MVRREYDAPLLDATFVETTPPDLFIIVPVDPGRCVDANAAVRPRSGPMISTHRPMADADDVDIVMMTINLTMATFIVIIRVR